MPTIEAYPILREFKADGDTATVKSLKMWLEDFHLEAPKTAVNDNNPDVTPSIVETRIDAVRAERLILSLAEDEICKTDSVYVRTTPTYSAALHEERFERVKRADKEHSPIVDVDAEAETIRFVDAKKMRAWLGADSDILDMAVEPHTTFEDVGRHIGANDNSAATEGKQEIQDVAATFYQHAA
jgi:hypothetical protein